ncbi:MAG TPA: NAD(P)-binding domain-containing protein [Steroidobacteraceae bacterium]|nr:NAD(P)-binding domain-containing protein [Steroidobacteraceae bacterium]
MNIGILGSGDVARSLARGFLQQGHAVMLGTRDTSKLSEWQRDHDRARAGSFADVAKFGEVLVLAVKGSVTSAVLRDAGAANLKGKVILDATNPIADAAPVNGVLKFFTDINKSLMETLQAEFPEARFVKAFNSVGNARMVHPRYSEGVPTMFICGNDEAAKKTASELIQSLGWGVADMGKVEAARAIEPLCMLWCIPGFKDNEWTHAFKLLRK